MTTQTTQDRDWIQSREGAQRRILCESKDLMMVEFKFDVDGAGLPHSHPHVQTTYVQSARFDFTIEGTEYQHSTGVSLSIHPMRCTLALASKPAI